MLFRILTLLLCAVLVAPVHAETPALHRGINLSNWLANAERQKVTEKDFQQIAQAGFDHIRLPVNPSRLGFRLDQNPDMLNFTDLDAALALAGKYKLAVILDIHPRADFMDELEKSREAEDHFIRMWDLIARHYDEAHYPDLIFGLLNEPHYYRNEKYYENFAKRIIAAIRQPSPSREIIVSAPRGAALDALAEMQPLDDPHILYDFHFYEPYIITHQGVHRGFEKKAIRYFHDLLYPSNLATKDASFYADAAPNPVLAAKDLKEYLDQSWNAEHIASRIQKVRAWADANHARVICGEFGVLRTHIDADSRYRWIADARAALDKNNIGWSLWDYSDLFGIVTYQGATSKPDPVDGSVHLTNATKGSHSIEPQALQALGLR